MRNTNLFEGRIVVERRVSSINGELVVIRDLAFGTYIHGGDIPQSGGLAESIWKQVLKNFKDRDITSCLIVGLGGGSIAKLVRKNWQASKIVGVDIDPVIVELGRKYLKLDQQEVEAHIEDAEKFIGEAVKAHDLYDLICFDTYVKQDFPSKFESIELIRNVKKLMAKNGMAIFNRLYGPDERKKAINFEKTLLKVFPKVDRFFPEANVMFVCS